MQEKNLSKVATQYSGQWRDRDANPGPLGPSASALTTTSVNETHSMKSGGQNTDFVSCDAVTVSNNGHINCTASDVTILHDTILYNTTV